MEYDRKALKEFQDLHLPKNKIYRFLEKYILHSKQLYINKFPTPGVSEGARVTRDGTVIRKCYRCLRRFQVTPDGKYMEKDECQYHPNKDKVIVFPDGNDYVYECCGKPTGSPGCTVFPLHICSIPLLNFTEFKSIRDPRQERVVIRGVYALDCEMVYTGVGMEVAKLGLVNEEGFIMYKSFVQPEHEVLDYCTAYSGITPQHLLGVTNTLSDVQDYLVRFLHSECILVGHSLESDLRCLRLSHNKIVDTSVVFSRNDGTKRKLKDLAYENLKLVVQNDGINGHDCIEDARTCMALMLNKIKQDRACEVMLPTPKNNVGLFMPIEKNMVFLNEKDLPVEVCHRRKKHRPEYRVVVKNGSFMKVCYFCTKKLFE